MIVGSGACHQWQYNIRGALRTQLTCSISGVDTCSSLGRSSLEKSVSCNVCRAFEL